MANTIVTEESSAPVTTGLLLMSWKEVLRVAIVGLLVGLSVYALTLVFDYYALTPMMCGNDNQTIFRCENKPMVASAAAIVLTAVGGLFALVQAHVYRPLLVVLLASVALWNAPLLVAQMSWLMAVLSVVVLFGITYVTMAWIAQLRNFFVALVLGIVLVVIVRLIISS